MSVKLCLFYFFYYKTEPVTTEDVATACQESDGIKEEMSDAQDKSGSD